MPIFSCPPKLGAGSVGPEDEGEAISLDGASSSEGQTSQQAERSHSDCSEVSKKQQKPNQKQELSRRSGPLQQPADKKQERDKKMAAAGQQTTNNKQQQNLNSDSENSQNSIGEYVKQKKNKKQSKPELPKTKLNFSSKSKIKQKPGEEDEQIDSGAKEGQPDALSDERSETAKTLARLAKLQQLATTPAPTGVSGSLISANWQAKLKDAVARARLSEKSANEYRKALARFERWWGDRHAGGARTRPLPSAVTREDFEGFRQECTTSSWALCKAALRFLVEHVWRARWKEWEPTAAVAFDDAPKIGQKRPHQARPATDWMAFFETSVKPEEEQSMIAWIWLYFGALRVQDLNSISTTVAVRPVAHGVCVGPWLQQKNKRDRTMILPKWAWERTERWRKSPEAEAARALHPVNFLFLPGTDAVRKRLSRLITRLWPGGGPAPSTHDGRHSFASQHA